MRAFVRAADAGAEAEKKADANDAKTKGNEFFKQGKLDQAVEWYSKAVELDPTNHVYMSNRAAAYLKQNEFALGLADCEAVQSMPTFASLAADQRMKCLFRKGLALAGLDKHGAAC